MLPPGKNGGRTTNDASSTHTPTTRAALAGAPPLGQEDEARGERQDARGLDERPERQQQSHADIDVQQREQRRDGG